MKETAFDRTWLAVLIIMALAAVVRFWGLDFGLPHTFVRPDESRAVNMAVKFGQGDLEPPFFIWPTLYPYLLSIVYGIYFVIGRATGIYGSVHDFAVEFATDPTIFYLLDRALSAVFGTLTVLVVFRIGERLGGRRTALMAALFLALAFLHVRDSHFGVTDVTMIFFIMTSTLYILKAGDTGKLRHYVLAGLLGGAAASTKYSGFMLVLPMLAAHFMVTPRTSEHFKCFIFDRRLYAFLVTMLVAFLAGTPYAAPEFSRLVADLSGLESDLNLGHHGIVLDRGWWHHLRFNLFYGMGWPLLAASFAGIIVLCKKAPKKAVVFLAFPLVYYVYAGKFNAVFARFIMPVVPFLCVAAAIAVDSLREYVVQRVSRRTATTAAWVLAIMLLLPSMVRIWHVDRLLNRTDNRILATEWIIKHLPPGASICQVDSGAGALQLDPGQIFLQKYSSYRRSINDGFNDQRLRGSVAAIADSLLAARRYRQWRYCPDLYEFSFDGEIQDSLPRYIIDHRAPLKHYGSTPEEITRLLIESYRLIIEFVAYDTTANNLYDWQDYFCVPLAGFEGVDRPGPNLYVYELTVPDKASPDISKQAAQKGQRANSNR